MTASWAGPEQILAETMGMRAPVGAWVLIHWTLHFALRHPSVAAAPFRDQLEGVVHGLGAQLVDRRAISAEALAAVESPETPCCLICHCTHSDACVTPDGSCAWDPRVLEAGHYICTACTAPTRPRILAPGDPDFSRALQAIAGGRG